MLSYRSPPWSLGVLHPQSKTLSVTCQTSNCYRQSFVKSCTLEYLVAVPQRKLGERPTCLQNPDPTLHREHVFTFSTFDSMTIVTINNYVIMNLLCHGVEASEFVSITVV